MAIGDVANVKLGPCKVTWNAVNLGFTKGGVDVEITTSKKKIMVDQFGETEVNEYIMGRQIMVRIPLAETDLTTLASVIPGSTIVSSVSQPTRKKVTVTSGSGLSLRSFADELVLHPFALPDATKTEDLTIPLAAPSGDISFSFRHDEERVYAVEFVGYVDNTTGVLYILGDPSTTTT